MLNRVPVHQPAEPEDNNKQNAEKEAFHMRILTRTQLGRLSGIEPELRAPQAPVLTITP